MTLTRKLEGAQLEAAAEEHAKLQMSLQKVVDESTQKDIIIQTLSDRMESFTKKLQSLDKVPG